VAGRQRGHGNAQHQSPELAAGLRHRTTTVQVDDFPTQVSRLLHDALRLRPRRPGMDFRSDRHVRWQENDHPSHQI